MVTSSLIEDRVHYLLSELTVPSLKDICRKKKLRGFSKLKKDDLVDFIVDYLVESEPISQLESLAESIVNFQTHDMLNIEKRIIDILSTELKFSGTFLPRGGKLVTCSYTSTSGEVTCTCEDFTDFNATCSHVKALISLAIASNLCSSNFISKYSLSDELISLAEEFLEEKAEISSETLQRYLEEDFAFSGRIEKAQELLKEKFDISFSPTGIRGHYLGKDKDTGELTPVFVIDFNRVNRTITHDCGDFIGRTSRMARACKHLVAIFLLWGKDNSDVQAIWQSITSCRWRLKPPE
ncbi:MAG: SWIM zinc finger family protein [Candidatus Hodarchaeota archaeon]